MPKPLRDVLHLIGRPLRSALAAVPILSRSVDTANALFPAESENGLKRGILADMPAERYLIYDAIHDTPVVRDLALHGCDDVDGVRCVVAVAIRPVEGNLSDDGRVCVVVHTRRIKAKGEEVASEDRSCGVGTKMGYTFCYYPDALRGMPVYNTVEMWHSIK